MSSQNGTSYYLTCISGLHFSPSGVHQASYKQCNFRANCYDITPENNSYIELPRLTPRHYNKVFWSYMLSPKRQCHQLLHQFSLLSLRLVKDSQNGNIIWKFNAGIVAPNNPFPLNCTYACPPNKDSNSWHSTYCKHLINTNLIFMINPLTAIKTNTEMN